MTEIKNNEEEIYRFSGFDGLSAKRTTKMKAHTKLALLALVLFIVSYIHGWISAIALRVHEDDVAHMALVWAIVSGLGCVAATFAAGLHFSNEKDQEIGDRLRQLKAAERANVDKV